MVMTLFFVALFSPRTFLPPSYHQAAFTFAAPKTVTSEIAILQVHS